MSPLLQRAFYNTGTSHWPTK